MPRYRNLKPSILGLSIGKATVDEKTGVQTAAPKQINVNPGEVFEAEKSDIPEIYFTQRWLEETSDPVTNQGGTAPGTNVGPYTDKNPDPVLQPQTTQNPDGSTADQPNPGGGQQALTGQSAPRPGTTSTTDTTDDHKRRR